jgi:two-component system response regulator HupR/HoxA
MILVVDDELRSRESLRRVLDQEFQVLLAESAAQARELLEQHGVAVILCDQRMPHVSGIEFLKEVRERWPDVVRIVLSGYTDSEDIIAGVNQAGIYQYLLKPWLPENLLNTVRNAVESQSLQNHMQRLDLELRAGTPALRRRSRETWNGYATLSISRASCAAPAVRWMPCVSWPHGSLAMTCRCCC